jgi:hypothetical protein
MEELIRQAFLHIEVIGRHVDDGHYDLIGPAGEIILPQVWEKIVEPNWAVTMHMWPMPESPPPASLPTLSTLPPPPPLQLEEEKKLEGLNVPTQLPMENEPVVQQVAEDVASTVNVAAKPLLPEKKKGIRLRDAEDRKFSFPFHLCVTWAVSIPSSISKLINFNTVCIIGYGETHSTCVSPRRRY